MADTKEYIPYGAEWKAEMMTLPKKILIDELKRAYIAKIEAENKLKNLK